MRLIDALENYAALADRIPVRFWFADERKREAAPGTCGYCAKGRTCTHEPVSRLALKPLTSMRQETALHRVAELKVDIDREIDRLPHRVRALFHLRYRLGLSIRETMGHLGLRQESDYHAAHGLHYEAMAIRLRHWFEPAEAAA